MDKSGQPIAQRSVEKVHFDHKDMDYYFSWILGREIYNGSQRDECFETAMRIEDGSPTSWQSGWEWLAATVEDQAQAARAVGSRELARKAYLRACTYYRAPLFIMDPADPRFRELVRKMQACFHTAASLFQPPVEPIQVPFRDKRLPGYFWTTDDSGKKRPTLIVIGGVETFAEDNYFITGHTGPRRGYNVAAVDLPGQGLAPGQRDNQQSDERQRFHFAPFLR